MTTICLGISFNFNASVEVIILSLSTLIKGKLPGLDPVAIIMFLASIVCSLSEEILMWFESIKLPIP